MKRPSPLSTVPTTPIYPSPSSSVATASPISTKSSSPKRSFFQRCSSIFSRRSSPEVQRESLPPPPPSPALFWDSGPRPKQRHNPPCPLPPPKTSSKDRRRKTLSVEHKRRVLLSTIRRSAHLPEDTACGIRQILAEVCPQAYWVSFTSRHVQTLLDANTGMTEPQLTAD